MVAQQQQLHAQPGDSRLKTNDGNALSGPRSALSADPAEEAKGGSGAVLCVRLSTMAHALESGPLEGIVPIDVVEAASALIGIALDLIRDHGGVVLSFDLASVVASFNVQSHCPEHCAAAAACALSIDEEFFLASQEAAEELGVEVGGGVAAGSVTASSLPGSVLAPGSAMAPGSASGLARRRWSYAVPNTPLLASSTETATHTTAASGRASSPALAGASSPKGRTASSRVASVAGSPRKSAVSSPQFSPSHSGSHIAGGAWNRDLQPAKAALCFSLLYCTRRR
jgi:class 3 adenylate cyclase